jgi:hypothetical protein
VDIPDSRGVAECGLPQNPAGKELRRRLFSAKGYGTLPVGGTLLGLGIIVPEEGVILRKGKG